MVDFAISGTRGDWILDRWELRLFGDFLLQRPDGQAVKVANQKVEGLLGVLAVNRELGTSRDELGEILWPDRPRENQRSSLRQALSVLRKLIGEHAVESSRTHLRLSTHFGVDCDYHYPKLRTSETFMPGQGGEWFAEIREVSIPHFDQDPLFASPTIVQKFLETVKWYGEFDSKGIFSALRSNLTLGDGIPHAQMARIMESFSNQVEIEGWAAFWLSTIASDLMKSVSLSRSALKIARRNNDLELASEVCTELGRAYIRSGKIARAENICNLSDAIAHELRTKQAKSNAHRIRAFFLASWGAPVEAFEQMRLCIEHTEDLAEKTQFQSILANWLASNGYFQEAEELLKTPSGLVKQLGHFGIEFNFELARLVVEAKTNLTNQTIKKLDELSRRAYSMEYGLYGMFADETLARILFLNGERALARQRIQTANRVMLAAKAVNTNLEANRIRTLR